jgi:LPXTG-motif cell wall-anchored protein
VTVIPGVINPPPPPPPGGGTTNPPPPGGGTTNPPPGSGGTPGAISNPPLPDTGVHASSMIRAAMLLGVLGLLMLAAGRRRRES